MTTRNITPEARERMRQGGRNRAKAFTSEYQKETRAQLPREACVAAGKAAYRKLIEQYGLEYAQTKAAEWRLEHPSNLEQIVMGWLEGVEHTREAKIKPAEDRWYFVDFLIGKIAIEVNGEWVHSQRQEKDTRKYQALAEAGYTVIIFPEADVMSGKAKEILDALFV